MVNIDSFKIDFSSEYPKAVVHIVVPDYTGLAVTKITIGTQNAYDTETDDFDVEKINYYVTVDNIVESSGIGWELNVDGNNITFKVDIDGNYMKTSDLFFVKIIDNADQLPIEIPCQYTNPNTWSSIYDSFSVDTKGMQYIRELANTCETPEGFITYILNREAMDVAADCGDYPTMITRYNELNNISTNTSVSSGGNYKACGCYG